MLFELDGVGTLAEQVYRNIKRLIEQGALGAGQKLPGSRQMMQEFGVSRNTVFSALRELEVEGYLYSVPRSGVFVSGNWVGQSSDSLPVDQRRSVQYTLPARLQGFVGSRFFAPDPIELRYDFRYGRVAFPDASRTAWRKARNFALRRTDSLSSYPDAEGDVELRQAICDRLYISRGISTTADNVIITGGTQETVSMTMGILVEPGDNVIVEFPGYWPIEWAADLWGAEVVRSAVDVHGIQPADLSGQSARLVVTTPSHQFPLGGVLPAHRRQALYKFAQQEDAFIFEDDYDGELRYDTRPIPALKSMDTDDRVIYAGSFSKTMHPTIRLGFAVVPKSLLSSIKALKGVLVGARSTNDQVAFAEFIIQGEYQKHLNRIRTVYRSRRDQLIDAISKYFKERASVFGSASGLHIAVCVSGASYSSKLHDALRAKQIGVTVLPEGLQDGKPRNQNLWLALSYGGINESHIEPGVRALAEML